MGEVFQFPTGVLGESDQDIEDRRLARERIAAVAYEEARRLCSNPRALAALANAADFEATVHGVAGILLQYTSAIVVEEAKSRSRHVVRGDACLPSESFDARNRKFVPPSRERKNR